LAAPRLLAGPVVWRPGNGQGWRGWGISLGLLAWFSASLQLGCPRGCLELVAVSVDLRLDVKVMC